MFIGHYGVALAAKRAAPRVSLGTLLMAAQWADLVWPVFLLLGIEGAHIVPGITRLTPLDFYNYPYTHSLFSGLLWAIALAAIYFRLRRDRRAARVLFACVVSHWFLDAVVHRPDLLIFPGAGPRIGLGLWNSLPGTLAAELGTFAAGLILYVRSTKPRDAVGVYGFWLVLLLIVGLWLGSLFGPPPPSERALALSALGQWLIVAWAYWIDRHRPSRLAVQQPA